jgi:hypothetical protein
MDQLASVLLDFPPAGGIADDDLYHLAARSHSLKVDKLAASQNFRDSAAQLLDVRGSYLSSWGFQLLTARSMSIQPSIPSHT